MALPEVGSPDEWRTARARLQGREEALREAQEAVVAARRRLPMVEVDTGHEVEGPAGRVGLVDLFEGYRRLLVYRFWFPAGTEPCPGCSMWVRNLGDVPALTDEDARLVLVSAASSAEIEAVRAERGWTVPWSGGADEAFDALTGYTGEPQITVFLRDGTRVYRTYEVHGHVMEGIGSFWSLRDLLPLPDTSGT